LFKILSELTHLFPRLEQNLIVRAVGRIESEVEVDSLQILPTLLPGPGLRQQLIVAPANRKVSETSAVDQGQLAASPISF